MYTEIATSATRIKCHSTFKIRNLIDGRQIDNLADAIARTIILHRFVEPEHPVLVHESKLIQKTLDVLIQNSQSLGSKKAMAAFFDEIKKVALARILREGMDEESELEALSELEDFSVENMFEDKLAR